jgi:hypothetical protein
MSDSEKIAEALTDFCNALESLAVNLRRQIQAITKIEVKVKISEERFNVLKWQDEKGERLGDFQAAYRSHNLPENWDHAWNILKRNNSLIANPFHEEGYEFRYWIYPEKYKDRIFRKKLSEAKG